MAEPDSLIDSLLEIRRAVLDAEVEFDDLIQKVHPNYRYNAKNFVRYLRLRSFDLRDIQEKLSLLGLSSISHSERHVLANLENILYYLHLIKGAHFQGKYTLGNHPVNFVESKNALRRNACRLFKSDDRTLHTHIMVTLPTEAVEYPVVKGLVDAGMEIARINCSHDDISVWYKMVENIKQARRDTGKSCSIYVDLAGPKLRTGEVIQVKKPHKKMRDYILLMTNDILLVHKAPIWGRDAIRDKKGKIIQPAAISISIPEVFDTIEAGHNIWFDDGAIWGVVKSKNDQFIEVVIKHANPKGSKLRSAKGINLPDTNLQFNGLTDDDISLLPFVVEHADMVGLSFVRYPSDVADLQQRLQKLGGDEVGIILKIENRDAFEHLPSLLLQAMQSPNIGVMTARGDLAVEIGAERLSEVQEEIMWLCEAALIPNIWATQVLENMAKKGIITRAEITDAAMSGRTECVMLNKGKYIESAVRTLVNILHRMGKNQVKQEGTMRKLGVVDAFLKKAKLPS